MLRNGANDAIVCRTFKLFASLPICYIWRFQDEKNTILVHIFTAYRVIIKERKFINKLSNSLKKCHERNNCRSILATSRHAVSRAACRTLRSVEVLRCDEKGNYIYYFSDLWLNYSYGIVYQNKILTFFAI